MRIRRHGTGDECRRLTEGLAEHFCVVSVSSSYPDRGTSSLVRVYVEIRLGAPPGPGTAPGGPAGDAEPEDARA